MYGGHTVFALNAPSGLIKQSKYEVYGTKSTKHSI